MEVAVVQSEPELLSNSLHILERVHPGTEHKEHRCGRPGLFVGHLEWDGSLLNILVTKLLLNKQSVVKVCRWKGAQFSKPEKNEVTNDELHS